jgi:hypothetical protein
LTEIRQKISQSVAKYINKLTDFSDEKSIQFGTDYRQFNQIGASPQSEEITRGGIYDIFDFGWDNCIFVSGGVNSFWGRTSF